MPPVNENENHPAQHEEKPSTAGSAKLRLAAAIAAATTPAAPATQPASPPKQEPAKKEDGELDDQVNPTIPPSFATHDDSIVPICQEHFSDTRPYGPVTLSRRVMFTIFPNLPLHSPSLP